MKKTIIALTIGMLSLTSLSSTVNANTAFGSSENIQKFYQGYDVNNFPLDKMQHWPYYNHVSMNMEDYVAFGVADVPASLTPALIKRAAKEIDLNSEFKNGQSFIENLIATQTKGFVVMKDNKILADFYSNGFKEGMVNNLQSASKTFAGVVIAQLVDQGKIDLEQKVDFYLPELKGTVIGKATVREVSNMNSGIEALSDYHTPGSNGYLWELEIGLQTNGKPQGHLNAIKNAKASKNEKGTTWDYSDQNTDTLGLIAESVSGKTMPQLLAAVAQSAGYNYKSSIAKTSDGTTSPSFGINLSAVDYALFHQYIAQGKAGETFYQTLKDVERDTLTTSSTGKFLAIEGGKTTYAMQSYYLAEHDIVMSLGSFGQIGFSDLKTGISVINIQDWSINIDSEKAPDAIARSIAIIKSLRS